MAKTLSRQAITGFITESRDSAYRLAYSYVRNREDALDIIQDSICKALSSAKSLDNPTALRAWFYRIVVNTALDFLRKHRRHMYVEADSLEAATDRYEDFDLRNAIASLSTVNQTVIILRFYENLTLDEIAAVLNENVNTIKTRLYSSLKKLRIELEEPDGLAQGFHDGGPQGDGQR